MSTSGPAPGQPAPNPAAAVPVVGASQPPSDREDIWEEALQSLKVEDQELVRLKSTDKLSVLTETLDAAKGKREQCREKQWKYKRSDGSTVVLHDLFGRIVARIEKLRHFGELAAGVDPIHAGLAWAVVDFFLKITISDSQTFAAIFEGLEVITEMLGRYAIFEELYLKKPARATNILKQAIVKLYSSILTFLAGAKKYYGQRTAKRVIKSLFNVEQHDLLILMDEIQQERGLVDEFARLIDAEYLRTTHEDIKTFTTRPQSNYTDLRKALEDLEAPINTTKDQLAVLTDHLEKSQRMAILDWVSKQPYSQYYDSIRRIRRGDIGLWLFDCPEYLQWRKVKTSKLLWLHGIPGSGKSILVSMVLDALKENPLNKQTEPVAYFYCARNSTEPHRGDPETIIRSLLRQLSCPKPTSPIRRPVLDKYRELDEQDFEARELSMTESVELLLALLAERSATIVIDGLDECVPDQRFKLFGAIEDILQRSGKPVKILVSSRDHKDIYSRLNKPTNLIIDSAKGTADMDKFIKLEVDRAVEDKALLNGEVSNDLQDKLIGSLKENAQGMQRRFLWVTLQIKGLCNPRKMKFEADVLEALGKLPAALADIYASIYEDIQEAAPKAQKIANTALKWLLCAQKPLSTSDFIRVVCFDVSGKEEPITARSLLDLCGNLLVVDGELDTFRFLHLSVREYLETRPGFATSLSNAAAADICLNLLLTRDWLSSDMTWQKATLYQYATLYWASHMEKCKQEDYGSTRIGENLLRFFSSGETVAPWFAKWLLQVESASETLGWDDPLKDKIEQALSRPPETHLFTACVFGFSDVVERLSKTNPVIVKRVNVKGATGLHLASQFGHLAITKILLDKEASINAKDEDGETALIRAAAGGHDQIVELLLSRGADPRIQGRKYGSAIQAASLRGHEAVVRSLLQSKVYVEAESGQFGTALQGASLRGHMKVIEILLQSGADVNAPGGEYTPTPSRGSGKMTENRIGQVIQFLMGEERYQETRRRPQDSPSYAHEKLVGLLLDGKIDINMQTAGFGPALHAAARAGHEQVVQILLDSGADVNAQGGAYRTALQAAAVGGNLAVVELLLAAGADVNTQDGLYDTALQAACRQKDLEIARILLSKGADVNARGGQYGAALHAACRSGQEELVELLLEHGADVNLQGGPYDTAIQAAAADGLTNIALIWILLVDNSEEAKVGRSLQIAAFGGHEHLVTFLIEEVEDINADGGCFGTALQTAIAGEHDRLVQSLIARGAEVNNYGRHFGSALQNAAAIGNKHLVKLLLEKGADPMRNSGGSGLATAKVMRGEYGGWGTSSDFHYPLEVACRGGHSEVVEILLDKAAVLGGHAHVLQILLNHGPAGALGAKALSKACKNGNEIMVRLLLENFTAGDLVRRTPSYLHLATHGNNEGIVGLLLEKGADVKADSGDGTPLHVACSLGRVKLCTIFVEKGADVSYKGNSKCPPLLMACVGGSDNIVEILLDRGADPNDRPDSGYSRQYEAIGLQYPLQAAAYKGSAKMVRHLLRRGAEVNAKGGDFETALQAACAKGTEDIVRVLLDHQANVNISGGKFASALQAAIVSKAKGVVSLLLDRGADPNIEGGSCWSSLIAAAMSGDEDIVRLLLIKGANTRPGPDYSAYWGDDTPKAPVTSGQSWQGGGAQFGSALQAAAYGGHKEIVEMLLEKGAHPDDQDRYGQTALHQAAHQGHKGIVELLLERGADVNCADSYGRTAVRWVANYGSNLILSLLRMKGAELRTTDKTGQNPLHRAAAAGHIAVAESLIESGIAVESEDASQRTPLGLAAENGQSAMIQFLLSKGAKIRPTNLHLAARKGHHGVVRQLLKAGADVNATTVVGRTALHEAAAANQYNAAYVLISSGAKLWAADREGRTPMTEANRPNNTVLSLLKVKGSQSGHYPYWG
ncbi:MAG: hypothetical protein M1840_008142 [Geoglossum simile]|nr:MAG: hypothetical protein M1840_008142 [Geoglossum simile]